MGGMTEMVEEFLNEQEIQFERLQDHPVFRFEVRGEHARYMCYLQVIEEHSQVLSYVCTPNNAPDTKRDSVAEFITRANYGMNLGNFELDYEDGEVRFKTSVDVEGGELTETMLRNLLTAGLTLTERYYRGLMAVMFSNSEPKRAILESESLASIPDEM